MSSLSHRFRSRTKTRSCGGDHQTSSSMCPRSSTLRNRPRAPAAPALSLFVVLVVLFVFVCLLGSVECSNSTTTTKLSSSTSTSPATTTTTTTTRRRLSIGCQYDSDCWSFMITKDSACINGTCMKLCSFSQHQHSNSEYESSDAADDCVFFHCDGKSALASDHRYEAAASASAAGNGSSSARSTLRSNSIETNNFPRLSRYLSNRKCSWILKNVNYYNTSSSLTPPPTNGSATSDDGSTLLLSPFPVIELDFVRFATELSNDYLYIFAGDSVFSPLIAALSGDQLPSYEPSRLADSASFAQQQQQQQQQQQPPMHLTFANLTNLYLLFKTDILPAYSGISNDKLYQSSNSYSSSDNKPNGISLKYKFSAPCGLLKTNVSTVRPCPPSTATTSRPASDAGRSLKDRAGAGILETLSTDEAPGGFVNSSSRRAHHCAFTYKNYLYVVGGYSFVSEALSFVARLDLVSLRWQSLDRPGLGVGSRPFGRYAHACVLDEKRARFFMFGGIKLSRKSASRQVTNELWSFDLGTNVWSLLHEDTLEFAARRPPVEQAKAKFGDRIVKEYTLPLAVMGHSMALVRSAAGRDRLLVFAGFSEYYASTLNIVQEFDLVDKSWSLRSVFDSSVTLGYGAALVHDAQTDTIFLQGGLVVSNSGSSGGGFTSLRMSTSEGNDDSAAASNGGTKHVHRRSKFFAPNLFLDSILPLQKPRSSSAPLPQLSSSLYAYDHRANQWRLLSSAAKPCYMHSASVYNGSLLFYGGLCLNRHKQQSSAVGAVVSAELRVFNLSGSGRWLRPSNEALNKEFYIDEDSESSADYGLDENEEDELGNTPILNYKRIFDKMVGVERLAKSAAATEQNSSSKTPDSAAASSHIKIEFAHRQRYSHSAHVYNGSSLLIFAGFNGFFLNDLFRFDLDKMSRLARLEAANCTRLEEMSARTMTCVGDDERTVKLKSARTGAASTTTTTTTRRRRQRRAVSAAGLSYRQEQNHILGLLEKKQKQHQISQMIQSSMDFCSQHSTCDSCQSYVNCVWNLKKCEYYSMARPFVDNETNFAGFIDEPSNETDMYRKPSCPLMCGQFKSCSNCTAAAAAFTSSYFNTYNELQLQQQHCVWCATQSRCVLRKAIHAYYPYGECMQFISERNQCAEKSAASFPSPLSEAVGQAPSAPSQQQQQSGQTLFISSHSNGGLDALSDFGLNDVVASGVGGVSGQQQQQQATAASAVPISLCSIYHSNCTSCIRDENCGWCTRDTSFPQMMLLGSALNQSSSGSGGGGNSMDWPTWMSQHRSLNTGNGLCVEGSQSGSLYGRCKLNWFFSTCPSCECNGHSTCDYRNLSLATANLSTLYQNASSGSVAAAATHQLDQNLKPNDYFLLSLFNLPIPSSAVCGPCLNNTEGEFCSQCKPGFFGNARNNGVCSACNCTNQANICDPSNGRCFCNTKGVVGSRCDQCETPRYTGRPSSPGGTCYYNLSTDYQFTFNLSKETDRHYTRINFVNHPTLGSDDDIDFIIKCTKKTARVNITFVAPYNLYDYDGPQPFGGNYFDSEVDPSAFNAYNPNFSTMLLSLNSLINKTAPSAASASNVSRPALSSYALHSSLYSSSGVYNYYFGPMAEQSVVLAQIECTNTEFKYTFSNRDFNYADKDRNATFVVYVYDFETPITIQIAFSRRSRLQLLHFFITFFGCLLSLLAIAFIMWKSKQRYDRYRRQRQIVMQMEYMSSRPFTRLLVEVGAEKANMLTTAAAVGAVDEKPADLSALSVVSRKQTGSVGSGKASKSAKSKKNSAEAGAVAAANESALSAVSVEASRGGRPKIMPVGVEPLSNNKTAIVTCLLKLPQGELSHTPKGASPLVLASAFVQINSSASFLATSSMVNADSLCYVDEQGGDDKPSKRGGVEA